jgi:hypothetical protein
MISEEIKQYLVKVCTILNSHNVEYLVVGGAAVSHYGFNRPSGIGQHNSKLKADLDFWYNPTVANFQNLVRALDELKIRKGSPTSLRTSLRSLYIGRGERLKQSPDYEVRNKGVVHTCC